jgi:hypothetical protein
VRTARFIPERVRREPASASEHAAHSRGKSVALLLPGMRFGQ